jgi:hypothetical protein
MDEIHKAQAHAPCSAILSYSAGRYDKKYLCSIVESLGRVSEASVGLSPRKEDNKRWEGTMVEVSDAADGIVGEKTT